MTADEFHAQLAMRDGEIAILKNDLLESKVHAECFVDQMWFWRAKYLKDHPEKDNWEYAVGAYTEETGKPSCGHCPPSAMHENQDTA